MARKPAEFNQHPLDLEYLQPTYRGVVKHVVDGDTLDVFIDLGLNQYAYETLRIAGIDTPEIYRAKDEDEKRAGFAARKRVEQLLLGKPVKIVTSKDKTSFGRYIADVYYAEELGDEVITWVSLAHTLVCEGLAKEV